MAACQVLVREWLALGGAYVRGDSPGSARWFPGCPARVSAGGVGGNRWLVMTPGPIPRDLRSPVSGNHRNAKRVSLANADKLKFPLESLSQRPKQPSAGGNVAKYSSKSGAKRDLLPRRPPRTMRIHGAVPSVNGSNDDEYGQIL